MNKTSGGESDEIYTKILNELMIIVHSRLLLCPNKIKVKARIDYVNQLT